MNDELNDKARALAKQYPLHDIVLAIAHAIDDGRRNGVLAGNREAVAGDVQALLDTFSKLVVARSATNRATIAIFLLLREGI